MESSPREDVIGQHSPRFPLLAMSCAAIAIASSLSFVFAILPPLGREMGFTELQVSMIVTPAAVVFMIAGLFWGKIGHVGHPKWIIIAALLVGCVTTIAFGLTINARLNGMLPLGWTLALLICLRTVLAFFAAGVFPAAQAYAAKVTTGHQRSGAIAQIGAGFALGLVAAPGFVTILSRFDLLAPFYGVAGIVGLTCVIVAVLLRDVGHPSRQAHSNFAGKTPLSMRRLSLAVLVVAYTVYAIVLQITGFRIQDQFGLSAAEAAGQSGIALMSTAGAMVLTQLIIARIQFRPRALNGVIVIGAAVTIGGLGMAGAVIAPCGLDFWAWPLSDSDWG